MGNESSTIIMNPIVFADEIWLKIFQYLTLEDLFFCIPNVNKHFYQISKDNTIWEQFGSKDWNNEKNIKAMYLKWVREQVDNYLKRKHNYLSTRGIPPPLGSIQPDYDFLQKILIVGDIGGGKSSLILRYTENVFHGSYISTIGVDFRLKKLKIQEKDLNMKLQIWDTGASRERYRSVPIAFYRGAQAILICYDSTTDNKSLENVNRWYASAIAHARDAIIVAVGTKCDIKNAEVVNAVEQCCKSLNIKHFETSAKDNSNIDELFYWITNAILDGSDISTVPGPKVTPRREFFIKYCSAHINVQNKKALCSLQ